MIGASINGGERNPICECASKMCTHAHMREGDRVCTGVNSKSTRKGKSEVETWGPSDCQIISIVLPKFHFANLS